MDKIKAANNLKWLYDCLGGMTIWSHDLLESLCFAIDVLHAPTIDPKSRRPHGRWISIDDEYPYICQQVLICINLFGGEQMVCEACLVEEYDRLYWHTADSEMNDADLDEVTHWMPLPKSPEEVNSK